MHYVLEPLSKKTKLRQELSVIPRLHDQATIKQTSSKYRAIRAHVVHVYFECICWMFA